MANTQAARLSFSVTDELGTSASIALYAMIDPAMTVAQLAAAWQAEELLLADILGAGIQRGTAQLVLIPTGGAVAPAAGSRVEQTGVLNFSNATTPHRNGVALAGLSDTVITAGQIVLTEGDPVDLFADSLTAAITGGGVFGNPAQQANTALVDAFLSFRKRRQLDRTSRELATT